MIGGEAVDPQEAAEDARESRARAKLPAGRRCDTHHNYAQDALGLRECPGCCRAVNRAQRSCGSCGWEFSAVEG